MQEGGIYCAYMILCVHIDLLERDGHMLLSPSGAVVVRRARRHSLLVVRNSSPPGAALRASSFTSTTSFVTGRLKTPVFVWISATRTPPSGPL
ncbi:unnamed protein product, partial [Brenthis ino]